MQAVLGRLVYFVQVAFWGMARARSLTAICTLTLAAALLVLGAFGMMLTNARDLVHVWGRGGHVSCGLKMGLPEAKMQAIALQVASLPGVVEARLEAPDEALRRFRARGPEAEHLTEGVSADMVPAALYVEPAQSLIAARALKQLFARISEVDGIEDVEYGEIQLERLRRMVRVLAWVGLGLGALMSSAMLFMVANTVRLMIHARRDEVRILRLVGATAFFVRAPFLLEGLMWGVMAGLLSALGLFGLDYALTEPLSYARQTLGNAIALKAFSTSLAGAQVVLGGLLGLLGSAVALGLTAEEDMG